MAANYLPSNLRFLRKNNGKSQADIALQVDKRGSAVSSWENGLSEPSITDLRIIADFFGVYIGDLIGIDLRNVEERQKIEVKKSNKNVEERVEVRVEENVHLNVHQRVHLNPEKEIAGKATPVISIMPKIVTVDSNGRDNMVLVDVKARAGYLNGYGDPTFIKDLQSFRLPNYKNGNYRMFEVAGLSMYPTLNDGDILITRAVESLDGIVNDRIHVVVTLNDGIVVKRVLNRVETDVKLILKSDNVKDRHEYPNMVIHPSEVQEIWFVAAYISRIMKSPSEMYERVTNLEGELTIVLDKLKKAGI